MRLARPGLAGETPPSSSRHIDSALERRSGATRRGDRWRPPPPRRPTESTGSKTIADLLPKAAEKFGDKPRRPLQERRRLEGRQLPRGRRDRVRDRARADRPRDPARRARLPPRQHAPGVDVRRLRHLDHRRRRRPDLPDQLPRGVRVGRRQLRLRRDRLRGRLAGREDRRGPRQPAEPQAHRRHRPGRRHRGRDQHGRPARARPQTRPGRAAPARRGRHARGPVHLHLHVGHHGPAEGLRPHARQLPRDHRLGHRPRPARATTTSRTSSSRSPTRSRCSSSSRRSTSARRSRTSAATPSRSSRS